MLVRKLRALLAALAMLALAAVIGALVGLFSVGFIELSGWLFAHGVGADGAHWSLILLLPAVAGVVSGLLCIRTSNKSPPGPAEVVRAKFEGLRLVSVKDGMLGSLASFTSLSLGGSVGAYGPLVHMGSTMSAQLMRLVGPKTASEIGLGCGCAAAIAAAFNAPLAGMVFAHEVILRHYSLRAFAPIASAALMSNWVSRHVFERPAFIETISMVRLGAVESLLFAVVGLACGVLAWMIIKGCLGLNSLSRRLLVPPWALPALGGLGAGAIALGIGGTEILGGGKPLIDIVAGGHVDDGSKVALLLAGKFAATVLCVGLGMAGGLFSPSLVIGLLFGLGFGTGLHAAFPDAGFASPVVYALVGMFATGAPVIGAPLAGIMIAVEFSQSYLLASSVAISIVLSTLVTARTAGGSYYQLQALGAGIPVDAGPEQRVLMKVRLRDRMRKASLDEDPSLASLSRMDKEASVWEALGKSEGSSGGRVAVTDNEGKVVGVVNMEDLLKELAELNRSFREEEGGL